jgi:hypothetical protein
MEVSIKAKQKPPSRLEGGGFEIRDIMSGADYATELDPFLVR